MTGPCYITQFSFAQVPLESQADVAVNQNNRQVVIACNVRLACPGPRSRRRVCGSRHTAESQKSLISSLSFCIADNGRRPNVDPSCRCPGTAAKLFLRQQPCFFSTSSHIASYLSKHCLSSSSTRVACSWASASPQHRTQALKQSSSSSFLPLSFLFTANRSADCFTSSSSLLCLSLRLFCHETGQSCLYLQACFMNTSCNISPSRLLLVSNCGCLRLVNLFLHPELCFKPFDQDELLLAMTFSDFLLS